MIKKVSFSQLFFFVFLLIGVFVSQNHLKTSTQTFLLFIGGITCLSFQLNEPKGATVLFYILLGIIFAQNILILLEWLRNFLSPPTNEPAMNLGELVSIFLTILFTPLSVVLYHKSAKRSIYTEQVVSWSYCFVTLWLLIKEFL
jgi:hypothetical protein